MRCANSWTRMTPSSKRIDWSSTATSIREMNAGLRVGGTESFGYFRDLVSYLFCVTIGHKDAGIHLTGIQGGKRATVEGRYGDGDSSVPLVRLTNNYFLRLVVGVYVDSSSNYMRTSISDFQYQKDELGDDWIFRYEYKRDKPNGETKPSAHLHVRGEPTATDVLREGKPLHKVHFPCGRPTIESTIRLLIDDFGVEPHAPETVWRPVLKESEDSFLGVAHKPEV